MDKTHLSTSSVISPKGGSQPDLSKLRDDGDLQHNVALRKRKQPEHDCCIKQDLADFRNEILLTLKTFCTAQNESMQAMQRELVADIKNQINSVTSLTEKILEDQCQMKSEISGLKDRLSSIEVKSNCLEGAADSLAEMKATVNNLITENNSIKQFALLNNVEVSGVPYVKGENLLTILRDICVKVGYSLLETDIDMIHRVRRFQTEQRDSHASMRPPAIIVKFTQRKRKDELLAAARARRGITTADIQLPGPASTLYLNDHLTPANKLLLKRARQIKTEHNYTYLWTRDCKIFIRKNEGSKVIHIADDSALLRLA
jgi:hypothetical protein